MENTIRKIALLDLDAFFASCEVLKNPNLKDIPFAVGGTSARSVVATCNYLAREFGVHSAMPMVRALKLCPKLKIVSGDMNFYKEISQEVFHILQQYTDIIQPASIDEFYLDLSQNDYFDGSASLTMEQIRSDIRKLGITGSAGISNQKMVAKIASDEKKPDGQFVVHPDKVKDYIAALELKRIPGVGPKTFEKLLKYKLRYGADIQQINQAELVHLLGYRFGTQLYQRCQGVDNRSVNIHRQRKSVGVEQTLFENIKTLEQAHDIFEENLWPKLQERLAKYGKNVGIKAQTVKLKTQDFNITTISRQTHHVSKELFLKLFDEVWLRTNKREVRLLGISVHLLQGDEKHQLAFLKLL
ncbi:MAG: DNA polymerase IV [Alphaproteobacteria bacterium]